MRSRCRGAALAIVMILLTGLGALALTAAAAAATALALAGHQQATLFAFEAAEAGLVEALAAAAIDAAPRATSEVAWPDETAATAFLATRTEVLEGIGAMPEGFTIGENTGAFTARHFRIVADGRAERRARLRLEQGFYIVELQP